MEIYFIWLIVLGSLALIHYLLLTISDLIIIIVLAVLIQPLVTIPELKSNR